MRSRLLPSTVLIVSVAALVLSLVWVSGTGPGSVGRGAGFGGMMGGIPGDGRVATMAGAERAAARFADRWGLQVGEIMEFSNGYYVELETEDGSLAAEVLVDPRTGAVQFEYGPAMMWNTAYGHMPGRWARAEAETVSPKEATAIADRWLNKHRRGLHAGETQLFPGYYTLHTMRGDRIEGMLSVNASSGAVWYHGWHGRFIRMREAA